MYRCLAQEGFILEEGWECTALFMKLEKKQKSPVRGENCDRRASHYPISELVRSFLVGLSASLWFISH